MTHHVGYSETKPTEEHLRWIAARSYLAQVPWAVFPSEELILQQSDI